MADITVEMVLISYFFRTCLFRSSYFSRDTRFLVWKNFSI